MDHEGLYEILDKLVKKPARKGASIGLTLLFKSAQVPQFYLDSMEFYAEILKGRALKEDMMFFGPETIENGSATSLAFMRCSGNLGFHEGFMFTAHPSGSDGWSSLQYSAGNGESAFSFLSSDLPELGCLDMADEVRYTLVAPPSEPSMDAMVGHFGRFEPASYSSGTVGRISPVSRGVMLAFYAKGWNLYEYDKNPKKRRKLAELGPAKALRHKKDYLVMPVADDSSSPDSIDLETEVMKRLGMHPRFVEGNVNEVIVAVRLMRGHLELVTKNAKCNLLMPYWGLRESIERHITAYAPQRDNS